MFKIGILPKLGQAHTCPHRTEWHVLVHAGRPHGRSRSMVPKDLWKTLDSLRAQLNGDRKHDRFLGFAIRRVGSQEELFLCTTIDGTSGHCDTTRHEVLKIATQHLTKCLQIINHRDAHNTLIGTKATKVPYVSASYLPYVCCNGLHRAKFYSSA
jgi:hypothetical protein